MMRNMRKPWAQGFLPGTIIFLGVLLAALAGAWPAQAAVITVTSPADNEEIHHSQLTITGKLAASAGVKITLLDVQGNSYLETEAQASSDGAFSVQVTLRPGLTTIKIAALEGTAETLLRVRYDDAPLIENLQPQDNHLTGQNGITIRGRAVNAQALYLKGPGGTEDSLQLDGAGNFSQDVTLTPGYNDYVVRAVAPSGRVTAKSLRIISDQGQPIAVITEPAQGATVYQARPVIRGYVRNTTSLKINGSTVSLGTQQEDGSRTFTYYLPVALVPGSNPLTLEAANGSETRSYNHSLIYQDKPVLTITSPSDGASVLARTLVVQGVVANASSLKISQQGAGKYLVRDSSVYWDSQGNFSYNLTLVPGANEITLTATNANGSTPPITFTVYYDGRPGIYVQSPAANTVVYSGTVQVKGTVSKAQKLKINDKEVYFDSQGNFSAAVSLSPGANQILLQAFDENLATTQYLIIYFDDSPVIEVNAPLDQDKVEATAVLVKGRIYNGGSGGVLVENRDPQGNLVASATLQPASDGTFSRVIKLKEGTNLLTLRATKGNYTALRTLTVISGGQPDLAILEPDDGDVLYSNVLDLQGQVKSGDQAIVKINGTEVTPDNDGIFTYTATLRPGTNTLTVIASQGKKTTKKTVKVYFSQLVKPGAYRRAAVPGNGGNTPFFDGQLILNIPKGTFREDKFLGVKVLDPEDYPAPAARELAGPVFRIDLPGTPLNTVTLGIKYSGLIRSALHRNISLCYYDSSREAWIPVGGKVDAKKGLVQAPISREGIYSVLVYYNSFNDIFNHWAREDIELLVARGIVNGTSATAFEPEKKITRAEFTAMLVRAMGLPELQPSQATFGDVSPAHWAYPYIETAARYGFVLGTSATRFSPAAALTREQAAVILARSANLAPLQDGQREAALAVFADQDQISYYARKGVAQAVKGKLLAGTGNGAFLPKGATTRAQAAAMMVRLLSQMKKI